MPSLLAVSLMQAKQVKKKRSLNCTCSYGSTLTTSRGFCSLRFFHFTLLESIFTVPSSLQSLQLVEVGQCFKSVATSSLIVILQINPATTNSSSSSLKIKTVSSTCYIYFLHLLQPFLKHNCLSKKKTNQ